MTRLRSEAALMIVGGVFGLCLMIPIYLYLSVDVSALAQQYPHARPVRDRVSFDLLPERPRGWVALSEISRFASGAIVLSEDWAFYQHQGLDYQQIQIAVSEMLEEKRVRGASTITQQMVKNVFLSEERTLWRKFHEWVLTVKAERALTKKRILEIYLNVIEFGPGIYGIHQASRHYFQKSPTNLGPVEGAFLAMLLPSPKRYYVSFKKKQLTTFARNRIQEILVKMRMGKLITPAEYEELRFTKLSWEKVGGEDIRRPRRLPR